MKNGRERDKDGSGYPAFNRMARAGSGGLAAASIGWTLALCIVGGAGAGLWLDNRFKTSYWTPILFLLGVVAGFLQMMRILREANALEEREARERRAQRELESTTQTATATLDAPVQARASRVPPPPTSLADIEGATPNASPLPNDIDANLAQIRELLAQDRARADEERKA